jgi:hypothetical protein
MPLWLGANVGMAEQEITETAQFLLARQSSTAKTWMQRDIDANFAASRRPAANPFSSSSCASPGSTRRARGPADALTRRCFAPNQRLARSKRLGRTSAPATARKARGRSRPPSYLSSVHDHVSATDFGSTSPCSEPGTRRCDAASASARRDTHSATATASVPFRLDR